MSAPLWLPGATVVSAPSDGGSMTGSDAYVTWHTFECDYTLSAVAGAKSLNSAGDSVHLTFNPVTGDVAQMIPANRAGRGLLNAAGGVETNRQGRVNIQIEVIARASRPWTQDLTAAGRAGLASIIGWLDDLGVPRTAPNGFVGPATYAASTKRARSLAAWNGPGGYFCHADVPENDHWDHGAVDMRDLWASTAPAQETPAVTIKNPATGVDATQDSALSSIWAYVFKNFGSLDALTKQVTDLQAQVADLKTQVASLQPGTPAAIDYDALATAVRDKLADGSTTFILGKA